MSTYEDRIARMHDRADEMKKQRMRRMLQIEGAVTGALGVCMVALIVVFGISSFGVVTTAGTGYAGATILNALVGNGIPVYFVAFLFCASLVFFIRTYREKKRQDKAAI